MPENVAKPLIGSELDKSVLDAHAPTFYRLAEIFQNYLSVDPQQLFVK